LGRSLSSAEAYRFLLVGGGHQYVMTSITRIGITADSELVCDFAARLLAMPRKEQNPDPVLGELEEERRRALQLVKSGAE
jgi:hypothetical protein